MVEDCFYYRNFSNVDYLISAQINSDFDKFLFIDQRDCLLKVICRISS